MVMINPAIYTNWGEIIYKETDILTVLEQNYIKVISTGADP